MGALVAIRAEPGRCRCAATRDRQPLVPLVNGGGEGEGERERAGEEKKEKKIKKRKKRGQKQRRSNLECTFDATLDRSRQRGTSLPNNRNTRSCPRPYARPDEVANGTRNESAALRSRRLPHVPSPKRPLGRLRAASRHLARLRETPRSARPYAPSLSRVAFLSLAPSNLLSSLICFLRTRRVRTMKKFSRNFFRRLRHFFFYNNSIQFF